MKSKTRLGNPLTISMRRNVVIMMVLPLIASCATKLKYEDKNSQINKNLEASISYPSGKYDCTLDPILGNTIRCDHFTLSVKNKSSQDYFIDWNNTYYLKNGQSSGGFYFPGIVIKDRNNPKSDDVILAESTITKEIYPTILTDINSHTGRWEVSGFPLAENGVYLTIKDSKGVKSVIKLNLLLSK